MVTMSPGFDFAIDIPQIKKIISTREKSQHAASDPVATMYRKELAQARCLDVEQ